MGLQLILDGVQKVGFPIAMAVFMLYLYGSRSKGFIQQLENLNKALNVMNISNRKSFESLVKQNNFMLHALSSMIVGDKESARKMMKEAIVVVDNIESDGDK
jgi:hypothetical protein